MDRLDTVNANEPMRNECSLVIDRRALMLQRKLNGERLIHSNCRDVAEYPYGVPILEMQTWDAFGGRHFNKQASHVCATADIAHDWTVPNFAQMLDELFEY